MALPMSNTPIYSLRVPSTKQEYKFKPLSKEDERYVTTKLHNASSDQLSLWLKNIVNATTMKDVF